MLAKLYVTYVRIGEERSEDREAAGSDSWLWGRILKY
jgi:hypothetical protein